MALDPTGLAKFIWSVLKDEKTETAIIPFLFTVLIALLNETLSQILEPKINHHALLRISGYVAVFLGLSTLAVLKKKRIEAKNESFERAKTISLLEKSLSEVSWLRNKENGDPYHSRWKGRTNEVIKKIYGNDSAEANEFDMIFYAPIGGHSDIDPGYNESYQKGLDKAEVLLKDLVEEQQQ
jgi:hypothetical protein